MGRTRRSTTDIDLCHGFAAALGGKPCKSCSHTSPGRKLGAFCWQVTSERSDYGEVLGLHGLLHTHVNEAGVACLFAALAWAARYCQLLLRRLPVRWALDGTSH